MLAIQSLKTQGRGSLQYISDDVLGQFLMELSANKLPADLHNVLTVMSCDQRTITPDILSPGQSGRTFLSEWIAPSTMAEEDQGTIIEAISSSNLLRSIIKTSLR